MFVIAKANTMKNITIGIIVLLFSSITSCESGRAFTAVGTALITGMGESEYEAASQNPVTSNEYTLQEAIEILDNLENEPRSEQTRFNAARSILKVDTSNSSAFNMAIETLCRLAIESQEEDMRLDSAIELRHSFDNIKSNSLRLIAVQAIVNATPIYAKGVSADRVERWLKDLQHYIPDNESKLQLDWARTVVELSAKQFDYFTINDAFEILTKLAKNTDNKNISISAFDTIEQAASSSKTSSQEPYMFQDRRVKRLALDALYDLRRSRDKELSKKAKQALSSLGD